jgi:hypothetical protein
LLAREYGYTVDQIERMTFRQVSYMLSRADVRKHNEFVAQASLHGAKLPLKHLEVEHEVNAFDDVSAQKAERAMEKAVERLRMGAKVGRHQNRR